MVRRLAAARRRRPLGIDFVVDPLGAGLAGFAALLAVAALRASPGTRSTPAGHLFDALVLVFLAAMVGFCLSGDLFNLSSSSS